jgi:peptidyl-prolyl cis-trans isomerase B (cyclophilin B)
VPTNQQRRDAAKRKLARQLARRQEQDRARRQRLVIVGVIAAVLVISGGVWLFLSQKSKDETAADSTTTAGSSASAETPTSEAPTTPCSYPASGTSAKDVSAPTNLEPLNSGTVQSTIVMNGQDVPISLDRALAPCGVNSFLSLASQGFFDDSTCTRLTVSDGLNILQCGDPSGKGNGGPGYSFASEVATDATYPVGTVALANAGADTNGSQFFIVYGPSTIPASYTIIGTVTGDGMSVVNGIAAQGVQKGAKSGPPNAEVVIAKVTVPGDALEGTGTYATTSAAANSELPSDVLPLESGAPTAEAPSVEVPAETPVESTPGGAG